MERQQMLGVNGHNPAAARAAGDNLRGCEARVAQLTAPRSVPNLFSSRSRPSARPLLVHARCLGGTLEYTRSAAKCRHQAELNLETLAWTRGRNMSLSGLRERMMCPSCGNRRVNLIFEPPPVAKRAPVA
jgi:hypothetical protein